MIINLNLNLKVWKSCSKSKHTRSFLKLKVSGANLSLGTPEAMLSGMLIYDEYIFSNIFEGLLNMRRSMRTF